MSSLKQQAQLEVLRRTAWTDFYIFAKHVCGWKQMEEQPHRELCDFVMLNLDKLVNNDGDPIMPGWNSPVTVEGCNAKYGTDWQGKPKKLTQVPRSTFKSTIITNALPLWLLWHNPNLRILIGSETLGNAKLYLSAIKDQIKNNDMVKQICVNSKGEYMLEGRYGETGGWVEDQIQLKHKTNTGQKEPSIFLTSAENAGTGKHPDVIIFDDLVSERNVTTPDQIQKTKEVYKYSLSLLDPNPGLMFIVGTRYHFHDLYAELISMPTMDKLVRPAVSVDGELYFPKRLTHAVLEDRRAEQGSYIFNCQYMLTPVDDSNAVFNMDWLKRCSDRNIEKEIVTKYILSDFAITEESKKKKGSDPDYTVIMTVGLTADKRIYVLDMIRGRFNPFQTIQHYFNMYKRHRAKKCQIETVAFQAAMTYLMKNEMRRQGVRLPLVETKPKKNKEARIRMTIPLFERGEVYFCSWVPDIAEFETEMREFPFGAHDDIIDSFANILEVMSPSTTIDTSVTDYEYEPGCSKTNY